MFKQRIFSTALYVSACGAIALAPGCKKQEPAKAAAAAPAPAAEAKAEAAPAAAPAAAPQLPDVELQGGNGVAGWLSFKSFNGLFDALEAVGGKLGALPRGGSMRGVAVGQLTAVAAQIGVRDLDWWDKTRPLHVGYYDEAAPAAGAAAAMGAQATGVFVVLPLTSADALTAALGQAKKGAEAEGHTAMLVGPSGDKAYVDVFDKWAVLTLGDKERFAKVSDFAKRIAAVEPPAVAYVGVSLEELVKTRKAQIDNLLTLLEKQEAQEAAPAGAAAAPPALAKSGASMAKSVRQWTTEGARIEVLIDASPDNLRAEVRMLAKDGTALAKQLDSGRGRLTRDIANLLPANSYLAISANNDPTPQPGQWDQALEVMRSVLQLDATAADEMIKDLRSLAELSDGTSALGAYPDGSAAAGLTMVAGVKDGAVAMPLGKKVFANIAVALLKMKGDDAKAGNPATQADKAKLLAALEQSAKEGKFDALLAAFGPAAEAMGVKLTSNTVREGDTTCDVLDIAIDASKLPANEAAQLKALTGDKTSAVLCGAKTKLAIAVGPSGLEKAKAAVAGKAGGLAEAPVYKAVTAANDGPLLVYLNPGALLAAFKPLLPGPIEMTGDKAVLVSCRNRAKSYACALDVPVDVLQAVAKVARPGGPTAAGDDAQQGLAADPGAAPAPSGGAPSGGAPAGGAPAGGIAPAAGGK